MYVKLVLLGLLYCTLSHFTYHTCCFCLLSLF